MDEDEAAAQRLLTPVMKLTTAKQSVAVASEVLEAFGGAGYVEDTGLPVILRDSQVLPIWEGTTNVLSLDAIRALGSDNRAFQILKLKVSRCLNTVRDSRLAEAARAAQSAFEHAESWLAEGGKEGSAAIEAGARRFAMTLGRTVALALLLEHAQWSQDQERDGRAAAAARRFAASGIDLIAAQELEDARALFEKA
jgi:hypothetical protein